MEKTLRKYGSSSSSSNSCQLDLNSIPFVIPKRYQVQNERVQGQDYTLDIKLFNYSFELEEQILHAKEEREAQERAAYEEAARLAQEEEAARQAEEAARQDALNAAERHINENGNDSHSSSDCEVVPEPSGSVHPTNPFLTVSGDVLIPTPSSSAITTTAHAPTRYDHQDIINSFDAQNSNPFDGAELQSLSNFDALKSVLAPMHTHDVSVLENNKTQQQPPEPVYAEVERRPPPPRPSQPPSTAATASLDNNAEEPVYSVVRKPPKVLKSKGEAADIEINMAGNGGSVIHQNFSAVSTPDYGFSITPGSNKAAGNVAPGGYRPSSLPPIQQSTAKPSENCFPKIPEAVIARVMQRLNHDQEKGYNYLKQVLELMQAEDCDAETADAVLQLDIDAKTRREAIKTIAQFSELGFPKDSIIYGFLQHPNDRDALLDYLTSRG